jgi:hypothetical protein
MKFLKNTHSGPKMNKWRYSAFYTAVFLCMVLVCIESVAHADIAQDREVAGRIIIARRTIQIMESDCLKAFQGLSCSVQSSLPQLIGPTLSLHAKTFRFTEGNQEPVLVEFIPSSTGYSLTVYPGSLDGPYLGYIKRSIRQLPSQFNATGLKFSED